MKNNADKDHQRTDFSDPASGGTSGLDYKRVAYNIIQYWYLMLLSIVITITIAFFVNRYSVKIYPVTASVIVREAEDFSGAEILYNNPLVNYRRNYLNEIYILKSFPLVQRVVEDLNFDISFFRKGSVVTSEVYDDLPIQAFAIRSESNKQIEFNLKVLDKERYELSTTTDSGEWAKTFYFNDTIRIHDFAGVVLPSPEKNLDVIRGERLLLKYTPSRVVADRYIRKLQADWAEEGAGVINLSIDGPNPRKEERFLAGLIAAYQNNDLNNKNETATRTVVFISEQLEGISDSLKTVEKQLQQFKNENPVTDLSLEAQRLFVKIEELEKQKGQLLVTRSYYKYLTDYIREDRNLHQIILPTSVGISDPILSGLVSQMTELQMEIKLSTKSENPLVTAGLNRINEIKKDILESVRNQQVTDKIKEDFVDKQIRAIEKQLGFLPSAQRNLVAIQRNYTLLENLYIFLLQKRSEAAISQASNTSDILSVNPPKFGPPTHPRPVRNYLLALALGICVPVLGFILRELLDTRIQSRDDIEKFTSIPLVAGLGHKQTQGNLAVFEKPKSALAESFRGLRSNLSYFIGQKEKALFLITSSISGEGKTFTSVNLAGVLSMSGKKTLLVGADMRKPKIFDDFGLSNDKGLSTFLAGLSSFNEVVQSTSYSNLDLISAGPIPPNPSELLLSDRLIEFINQVKSRYDYVVIDTPPLALVTDAFLLSPHADHVLFLVRQNYTPKSLLRSAEEFYVAGKITKISLVLNDIFKSGPGYGYGYDYGYGYGYSYGYLGTKSKESNGYYSN